jgi:hypothetical protein
MGNFKNLNQINQLYCTVCIRFIKLRSTKKFKENYIQNLLGSFLTNYLNSSKEFTGLVLHRYVFKTGINSKLP